MPDHPEGHRNALRDVSLGLSVLLVLAALLGTLSTVLLPAAVTFEQPHPILTPQVFAGKAVQAQIAYCMRWPWPVQRIAKIALERLDETYLRTLLQTEVVLEPASPCRQVAKPVFTVPADVSAGRYQLRFDVVLTEQLAFWQNWRRETLVLVSEPFTLVAPGAP